LDPTKNFEDFLVGVWGKTSFATNFTNIERGLSNGHASNIFLKSLINPRPLASGYTSIKRSLDNAAFFRH